MTGNFQKSCLYEDVLVLWNICSPFITASPQPSESRAGWRAAFKEKPHWV